MRLLAADRKDGKPRRSRAYRILPEVRAQAERWLAQGFRAAELAPAGLEGLKGSDPRKLAIAGLLWKRTTVSQEWIAARESR